MESTAPKPFVFVLMPFGPEFDDVYQLGIKAACQEAGAYCERLDEQIFHENMLDRIYNQISKADIIVADMSGRNPNVFYEVGYAHALNKIVVILTNRADDIPFDLKHYPHIVYGGRVHFIKEELRKKIHHFSATPRDHESSKHPAQFFLNDQKIDVGSEVLIPKDDVIKINMKFQNLSSYTFKENLFKISITTPRCFELYIKRRFKIQREAAISVLGRTIIDEEIDPNYDHLETPDGKSMFYIHCQENVFPGQWISTDITIGFNSNGQCSDLNEASLSLYLDSGLVSIPFVIKLHEVEDTQGWL